MSRFSLPRVIDNFHWVVCMKDEFSLTSFALTSVICKLTCEQKKNESTCRAPKIINSHTFRLFNHHCLCVLDERKKSCWLVVWVFLEHLQTQCEPMVLGSSLGSGKLAAEVFSCFDPYRNLLWYSTSFLLILGIPVRYKANTRTRPLSAYNCSIFSTSFLWRPVHTAYRASSSAACQVFP